MCKMGQQMVATVALGLVGLVGVVGCILVANSGHEIPPALSTIAGTAAGGLISVVTRADGHGHVSPETFAHDRPSEVLARKA